MLTENQMREIELGWRRGNDALLDIVMHKGPRSQWMAGAALQARARAKVVIAALEANHFFTTWIPVWLERAEAANRAGNQARRSYYLCMANAGRDAARDAMQSARGEGMQKTIIWLTGENRPLG